MNTKIKKLLCTFMCALLILWVTACSTSNSAQSSTLKVEPTSVNIGENVDFTSYDPIGIGDSLGFYHYSSLVYEPLFCFENGEPKPNLVESWENEEVSWTFHLRKGVKFTDGEDFNAAAVKLNIEKLQEFCPDFISYYRAISGVTSIETPDEHTVILRYETPYYAVLQEYSGAFGMLSPKMFENGNNPYGNTLSDTAGTGPYQLKKENCINGQSYIFTRNENHWSEAIGPDSFTVKIIPDADSRLMAMQVGEIDLLYGSYQITYDMFEQLSAAQNIEAVSSDLLYNTRNLLLNTDSKILGDLKVRKAIQHATNKQQIVDSILYGLEKKADYLLAHSLPFCDVDTIIYNFDLSKAESLLYESGWKEKNVNGIRVKDGKTLTLQVIYCSDKDIDLQMLTAFKGQMNILGVDVQIQGYEMMTWFEKGLAGEFDISVNDTYAFPQDPYVFLAAMTDYGLDNPAQQGLAQKPEIDAHILNMLQTVDEEKIQTNFDYILTTLQEEAVNIPISYLKELVVYNSKKIQDVTFGENPLYLDISKIKLR